MTEQPTPDRRGIDDDTTMIRLIYDAIIAVPAARRASIVDFVIERLEFERKEKLADSVPRG